MRCEMRDSPEEENRTVKDKRAENIVREVIWLRRIGFAIGRVVWRQIKRSATNTNPADVTG
jgi:hypothetical protein